MFPLAGMGLLHGGVSAGISPAGNGTALPPTPPGIGLLSSPGLGFVPGFVGGGRPL